MKCSMRLFVFQRIEDESGMSGTGIVAEGVEFSNGMVVITWLTPYRKVDVCENIKALEAVHGHGGKTKIVFFDLPSEPGIVEDSSS